jgi:hypothetical protein
MCAKEFQESVVIEEKPKTHEDLYKEFIKRMKEKEKHDRNK